ncbi:MAG TPA: hypothetical protein VGQ04_05280 [Chitinophagaceae bacterium]|nr:hypothetical protein [Chitinophagaceae bacterium]
MNELILFTVVAVIIFGGYFLLKKVPKPAINYIRIASSVLLLVLVWWAWGGDGDRAPKFILTALAIASLIKELFALKNFYSKA